MKKDTLEDHVAMLLGKSPYDHPSNICWNDPYFARSLIAKYGEKAVEEEIARQKKGEK